MELNKKGFSPSIKPLWRKRLESILLYITDLEQCLDAANRRVRELADENELLRRNANCPYSWLASPDEAGKEEGHV